MIRFLKEVYCTGFIIGHRLRFPQRLGGGWGPDMDNARGVLFVSLIQGLILLNLECLIQVRFGTMIIPSISKWMILCVYAVLFCTNYYVLVIRRYGVKYVQQYSNLNKYRKVILLGSWAILLLVILVFSIYTVSVYRRYFHLVPDGV